MQDIKIMLKQNHIGRFFSDVSASIYGYSNIGGMKSRRIVDAVPEEAHRAPGSLQCEKDSLFLLRSYATEDVNRWELGPECVLAECSSSRPVNRPLIDTPISFRYALLFARCRRSGFSPQHRAGQRLDGGAASDLGGSTNTAKPEKVSSVSSSTTACHACGRRLARDAQHAVSLVAQLLESDEPPPASSSMGTPCPSRPVSPRA